MCGHSNWKRCSTKRFSICGNPWNIQTLGGYVCSQCVPCYYVFLLPGRFPSFFNNPCTCKVVKSSSQPFIQFFWRLVLLQYLSHIVQLFMSIFVVVKQTKSHNQTPNWNFWLCTVIYLHLWCHNITSGFTKHYTSSILYLNLSNRFTGTWWFSEFTGKNLSSLHRCTTQCNPEYHKWTWWRSIYLLRLSC